MMFLLLSSLLRELLDLQQPYYLRNEAVAVWLFLEQYCLPVGKRLNSLWTRWEGSVTTQRALFPRLSLNSLMGRVRPWWLSLPFSLHVTGSFHLSLCCYHIIKWCRYSSALVKGEESFLRSTTSCLVLLTLGNRWLIVVSTLPPLSSADLTSCFVMNSELWPCISRVKNKGLSTHSWGTPV